MTPDQEGAVPAADGAPVEKKGGCLNLGWGCLPVLIGGFLLLPVGLWF